MKEKTEVGYWSSVVQAIAPCRLQVARDGAEFGKPEIKVESAGGNFLSCSSLELQDTNGALENQNWFTMCVYMALNYCISAWRK